MLNVSFPSFIHKTSTSIKIFSLNSYQYFHLPSAPTAPADVQLYGMTNVKNVAIGLSFCDQHQKLQVHSFPVINVPMYLQTHVATRYLLFCGKFTDYKLHSGRSKSHCLVLVYHNIGRTPISIQLIYLFIYLFICLFVS